MEKPYTGRAIIDDSYNGLQITVPSAKNWFVILFLGAWLGGWLMGESFALGSILGIGSNKAFGGGGLFLVFWLAGWTVGGFFAFRFFLWNLLGKEIITIGQGELKIEKKGDPLTKTKTYDLNEAKNFKAKEDVNTAYGNLPRRNLSAFGGGGTLRFDYGLQTVKFGIGLDVAEGNYILSTLKAKRILTDKNFEQRA